MRERLEYLKIESLHDHRQLNSVYFFNTTPIPFDTLVRNTVPGMMVMIYLGKIESAIHIRSTNRFSRWRLLRYWSALGGNGVGTSRDNSISRLATKPFIPLSHPLWSLSLPLKALIWVVPCSLVAVDKLFENDKTMYCLSIYIHTYVWYANI